MPAMRKASRSVPPGWPALANSRSRIGSTALASASSPGVSADRPAGGRSRPKMRDENWNLAFESVRPPRLAPTRRSDLRLSARNAASDPVGPRLVAVIACGFQGATAIRGRIVAWSVAAAWFTTRRSCWRCRGDAGREHDGGRLMSSVQVRQRAISGGAEQGQGDAGRLSRILDARDCGARLDELFLTRISGHDRWRDVQSRKRG